MSGDDEDGNVADPEEGEFETATFGIGSFWAAAAAFRVSMLVRRWRVGYLGGVVDDPLPEQVATNTTGHAEVVELLYEPEAISYAELLLCFWNAHDPTAAPLDGDVSGHRFRSIVAFHTPEQEAIARAWKADPESLFDAVPKGRRSAAREQRPPRIDAAAIRTDVVPASTFWPASAGEAEALDRHLFWTDVLKVQLRALHADRGLSPVPTGDDLELLAMFDEHLDMEAFDHLIGRTHRDALRHAILRSAKPLPGPQVWPPSASGIAARDLSTEGRVRWSWPGVDHSLHVSLIPGPYTQRAAIDETHRGLTVGLLIWTAEQFALEPVNRLGDQSDGWPTPTVGPWRPTSKSEVATRDAEVDPDAEIVDRWWESVPDATFALSFGENDDDVHRVRWAAGRIHLLDHPGDVEVERTMGALAGIDCNCFLFGHFWSPKWFRQRWFHSSLVAFLGRFVGGRDEVTAFHPSLARHFFNRMRHQVSDLPSLEPPDDESSGRDPFDSSESFTARVVADQHVATILRLLSTPMLQRWFVAGLVAREAELPGDLRPGAMSDYLDEGVYSQYALAPIRNAVAASLWQRIRSDPSVIYAHVVCRLLPRGETAKAEAFVDDDAATAHILVSIPLRWLYTVWLRGLSVVDGLLVLDVDGPTDAEALDATVAGWHRARPGTDLRLHTGPAKLCWDGTQWRAAAEACESRK